MSIATTFYHHLLLLSQSPPRPHMLLQTPAAPVIFSILALPAITATPFPMGCVLVSPMVPNCKQPTARFFPSVVHSPHYPYVLAKPMFFLP
jgi:hypothetical protein